MSDFDRDVRERRIAEPESDNAELRAVASECDPPTCNYCSAKALTSEYHHDPDHGAILHRLPSEPEYGLDDRVLWTSVRCTACGMCYTGSISDVLQCWFVAGYKFATNH